MGVDTAAPPGFRPAAPTARPIRSGSDSENRGGARSTTGVRFVPRRTVSQHLLASIGALAGAALTFYFVSTMNHERSARSTALHPRFTSFEVERRRPERRRRLPTVTHRRVAVQHRVDPRAALPNLTSRISATDVGLRIDDEGLYSPAGQLQQALTQTTAGARLRVAMEPDAVDTPARAMRRVAPAYPQAALKRGITGYVRFKLLIDEDGSVQRVQIADADPQGVFEEAARQVIDQWSFKAGLEAGMPVASWAFQTVRFELQ